MQCTHIALISSNLTQSGLDCTLLHIPCTQMIDFQPFETIRFVPYPPSHAMHTHRIDFQPFDTIKFGPYPPHYMPCTHIELISSHLTQSGLDRTLPLHAMHTHRIDFQQFDTIRSRFGPHPPPNAVHTHTIEFQPFDEKNQDWTVPFS